MPHDNMLVVHRYIYTPPQKLHGTVCNPPHALSYSCFSPSSPIPLIIYDATALEPLHSVSTNSSLVTGSGLLTSSQSYTSANSSPPPTPHWPGYTS
jgi:hypothetical protein